MSPRLALLRRLVQWANAGHEWWAVESLQEWNDCWEVLHKEELVEAHSGFPGVRITEAGRAAVRDGEVRGEH